GHAAAPRDRDRPGDRLYGLPRLRPQRRAGVVVRLRRRVAALAGAAGPLAIHLPLCPPRPPRLTVWPARRRPPVPLPPAPPRRTPRQQHRLDAEVKTKKAHPSLWVGLSGLIPIRSNAAACGWPCTSRR